MSSRLESSRKRREGRALCLNVVLESRPQSADVAESLILEFCGRAQFDQRDCEEIGLAVREAVANAVLHGNRCDMGKKVGLTAEVDDAGVVISIRDEGEGFDPQSIPDPLVPDNLLNESGRGFFLVKTCMDDVILRRVPACGMEITLIKHITKSSLRRMRR